MAAPEEPSTQIPETPPRRLVQFTPDLEQELREAVAEIERGDCIELTPEQLDRCIEHGEWPWPDAFPG